MENQYGTSVTGNLYHINYCEEGTRNTSIGSLGVMTNVTIDCTALGSRHRGSFIWTPRLPVLLLPSFWHLYFGLNIKQRWFLSTLAIILGVLMAFQGLLQLLSVGEPTYFQGQEKTSETRRTFQMGSQGRIEIHFLTNLQRLLINTKWKNHNSLKESVCSNTFRFLMDKHSCWNVSLNIL